MPPHKKPQIPSPKRVTLQDIADAAGVGKMVVSNALNGTRSVAPATREKILRLAGEMNYIPNFAARALTEGCTKIIAVVSGPLNESYYASMVHHLEQQITADSYHLVLMRTRHGVEELVSATGRLAVDGAIAIDMLGLVNEFRSHPTVPCVSISTTTQAQVDNVIIDLSAGVEEAIALMVGAGRQRVAYLVTAEILMQEAEARARAYNSAMKKAGRVPEVINLETDDIEAVAGRFKEHVARHGCPDALLCINDETAISILQALRELGHTVPGDVLLVGCDGQRHTKYLQPPLSTIAQPVAQSCALAWKFLKRRLADPALPRQEAVLEGQLLARESLGSLATTATTKAQGEPRSRKASPSGRRKPRATPE